MKLLDEVGAMVLQVTRTLHAKTQRLELQIPQEFWEDFFEVTDEEGPQTVLDAYAYARQFWDQLAEENADRLERAAVPGATSTRLRNAWPDYLSLEAAYRKQARRGD